jgi:hypothetical protein
MNRGGNLHRIIRIGQKARVADDFDERPAPRGDHRAPVCHGLNHRQTKAFRAGEHKQGGGAAILPTKLFVADTAQELGARVSLHLLIGL